MQSWDRSALPSRCDLPQSHQLSLLLGFVGLPPAPEISPCLTPTNIHVYDFSQPQKQYNLAFLDNLGRHPFPLSLFHHSPLGYGADPPVCHPQLLPHMAAVEGKRTLAFSSAMLVKKVSSSAIRDGRKLLGPRYSKAEGLRSASSRKHGLQSDPARQRGHSLRPDGQEDVKTSDTERWHQAALTCSTWPSAPSTLQDRSLSSPGQPRSCGNTVQGSPSSRNAFP